MVFAVAILLSLSFLAIYSIGLSQDGQSFVLIKKQLLALGIGLLLAGVIGRSNYRWTLVFNTVIYGAAVILLIGVLFFGQTIRGTTGWFSLFSVHFQPVELVKLAIVIVLANYFSKISQPLLSWRQIFFSAGLVGLPIFLTLLQPDLGSALLLGAIWLIMIFFAGLRPRQFLVLFLLFSLLMILAWQFFLVDYQKARLVSFIDPASDPMGEGYNVHQAIIAVGSGGLFGRGLGFGSQSQLKFLPESQTDFIFAVIAEEFGLFGVILIFLGFYLFLQRLFRRACTTGDSFTSFLLLGISALFFVSFVVNVGMNLGLLPVTGIALPLVSYGGSSLIISLIMVGLGESVAGHDISVSGGSEIKVR